MHHLPIDLPDRPRRASAARRALVAAVVGGLLGPVGAAGQDAPPSDAAAEAPPAAEPAAPALATLELAGTLQSVGRLESCAVEALRHAHLHPADAAAGVDLAARCLVQAGQWDQVHRLLWHPRHQPLRDQSQTLRWHACVVSAAVGGAEPLPAECRAAAGDSRLALLPAAAALAAGQWQAPVVALPRAGTPAGLEPMAGDLRSWGAQALHLPAPSPLAAAALSAVVPGLGRVYLGRWQEGLTSLVIVGAPAWFAYGGFERDGVESVRGWLLATTTAVFYLGNVYGSWVGAETDRRKAEKRLREEVRTGLGRWVQP